MEALRHEQAIVKTAASFRDERSKGLWVGGKDLGWRRLRYIGLSGERVKVASVVDGGPQLTLGVALSAVRPFTSPA